MVNADTKEEQEANIFSEATYFLHESFGDKAKQGTSAAETGGFLFHT